MQYAVDSVANADNFFKRLDVNIGGPKLHRLLNHELDQTDDRGTVFIDNLSSANRLSSRFGLGEVNLGISELLQHRIGRLTFDLAVVLIDRFQDFVAWGQCDFDSAVENEPQLFDGIDVV